MSEFEELLWEHMRAFEEVAKESPTLLVDCARIIEVQERLDKQIIKSKVEGMVPKRFKLKLQVRCELRAVMPPLCHLNSSRERKVNMDRPSLAGPAPAG
jgi:hypothetical protein